ncbi:ATP-dependent HslUV protease subunit HslV [Neorhizobium galegae]|uniref:hypothetical protein n=1 Tax=Neorhizobium galegae TaxID=399 RepID=UPI00278818E6|nr:hypothetical protein [Neorhizobium galegae]MDQ0135698.1 ATP-dependent HslUV protease subunit HslV [Neorhizobium galegae]
MTTIAYRDGIMAADSGAWIGGAATPWAYKLAIGPDGTLYGVAGNAAEAERFLQWVRDGCHGEHPKAEPLPEQYSSYIVLAAPVVGPIRVITARGDEVYHAPYFAIGAGSVAALGAMFANADAETAIQAAICHASGACGTIRTIQHPHPEKKL